MKKLLAALFFLSPIAVFAEDTPEMVILDADRVRNLGIETVEARKIVFEETVFAIGRIEVIPSKRGVVSSRVPGRIAEMRAFEGDFVKKGQPVVRIESRQPGDPPPSIDLVAPLSGLVMETHSSIGEPIEPDTDVLEINDLSEVYAVARLPEDIAGRLGKGARARIKVAILPDKEFDGTLLRFGTRADSVGGTIDAIFHLTGLDGTLRPQMRTEFSIIASERKDVRAIPIEALQGTDAAPFVFVKHFELPHAFVKAPVQVGARNDRFVEIMKGIFPRDEVVTKGAYPLVFAGAGRMSLKEALDAAHGHEHNEDGSELTPEQLAAKESEANSGGTQAATGLGAYGMPLLIYSIVVSLLFAFVTQLLVRKGKGAADV